MKKLSIDKTTNTPLVDFNPETGQLKMEGRSIPENPGDFYESLINWVNEYFKAPLDVTTFELNLEYINSGSSKYLLGLFRILKEQHENGNKINVNWYFEEDDEAIQGLGEHYKHSLKIPFNLIEYI